MRITTLLASLMVLLLSGVSVRGQSAGSQTEAQEETPTDPWSLYMQERGIADDPDMVFVTGTHFESSDTDVVVDTSAEVTVMLETTNQEVAMYIDQGADSTTFTVSGMAPLTVYYLYKDSYLDVSVITTDTTGSYTFTLDTSDNHYVWFQPYPSTVVISDPGGGGCSFVGTWDAGSKTCTLTTDLTESVEIASGITLDCAGHKITGPGFGNGVLISASQAEATVTDCEISAFSNGINAVNSDGFHTFTSNNIHDIVSNGIRILRGGGSNFLTSNSIQNVRRAVLLLLGEGSNTVQNNIISDFFSDAIFFFRTGDSNTIQGNTIDGGAGPKAAFQVGIRVIRGSGGNQILNNTILNSVIPIGVTSSNANNISGNTVDTGVFGIDFDGADLNEITDNDITGQGVFAIFIAGSFNTIAYNHIHESAGIRIAFFDVVGPTNSNVVKGNIIENGIGNIVCSGDPLCDSGILLTAARAQIEFSNAFGDGFMDNNTITGNTIRNFPGWGIEFDNTGPNNVVSDNVITENVLGGILLAHRCPTCEYKFMRNDIVNNGGTPLVSRDSVYSQNFVRTLLGPLAVDIAGDDGLGNPIGNFWGRTTPPCFVPGLDSNAASVIDSAPVCVPFHLTNIIGLLDAIVLDNPGTPLADKVEDVIAKLQSAVDELNKTPPDNQAAVGNIEGAVGDLEAAIGLDPVQDPILTDAMDQLAGIARQLASEAVDQAIAGAGDPVKIADAQQALADGDVLRASAAFKDAISKYKDALAKAES